MSNFLFIKYLLKPENSSNSSMDPFCSLVPDGKRYTDLIRQDCIC